MADHLFARQFSLLLFLAVPGLLAQGPLVIVESGYISPMPMQLAPGQVVTLFVSGIADHRKAVAEGLPLPTQLAGISITLRQRSLPNTIRLPLLVVERAPGTDFLTAITAQVPFEMVVGFTDRAERGGLPTIEAVELVVTQDGMSGPVIPFMSVADSVHIVTSCDQRAPRFVKPFLFRDTCVAIVTHSDGSKLGVNNPAKPGEIVVMYAFGLGPTEPRVRTGESNPAPMPIDPRKWVLDFEFGPNVPAKYVPPVSASVGFDGLPRPLYVGLVPGFVGLYQINFKVPEEIPLGTPRCEGFIFSNLTVTLFGATSSDAAAICVEVPSPTTSQTASRQSSPATFSNNKLSLPTWLRPWRLPEQVELKKVTPE